MPCPCLPLAASLSPCVLQASVRGWMDKPSIVMVGSFAGKVSRWPRGPQPAASVCHPSTHIRAARARHDAVP